MKSAPRVRVRGTVRFAEQKCKESNMKMDEVFTEVFGDGDMLVNKALVFEDRGDYFAVVGYNGEDERLIVPSWYKYKPVEEIAEGVFAGRECIERVTIGDNIKRIGKDAFSGCVSLVEANIPNAIESIGEGAFSGCASLKSITIPASVEEIGAGAFSGFSGFRAYCYVSKKPDGWADDWLPKDAKVEWQGASALLDELLSLFD